MLRRHTIAIIDDDEATREALDDLVRSYGYESRVFESAKHFLDMFTGTDDIGCMLLDVNMPGMTGIELQRLLADRSDVTPIIFISSCHDLRIRSAALNTGGVAFFSKPADVVTLMETIDRVMRPPAAA